MNRHAPQSGAALCTTITVIVALVLGAASMSAQAIFPVVGSGAVSASDSHARLTATIGQSAIGFTAATSTEASQGFWFSRTSVPASTAQEDFVSSSILILSGAPNPLSRSTTLSYYVPHKGHVSLILYNAIGRQVMTVLDEERDAGATSEQADLSGLPSGSYAAVLSIDGRRGTTTLLLVD